MSLSIEQKATNFETFQHIEQVMRFLAKMQFEIYKRMFSHDQTKLLPPEVSTFTEWTPKLKGSTYGTPEYKEMLAQMKPALDHHYANNRHHAEHFENGVDDMNLIDLIEMVCDWKAATMRHADGDINKSIEINTTRYNLAPQLVLIIKNTVPLLEDIFNFDSQKTL